MSPRLRQKARRGIWDKRFLNGCPSNITEATKLYIMRGVAAGLVCTATTNGVHATGSFHYSGQAADMGLEDRLIGTRRGMWRMRRFQRHECWRHRERYMELFGPINDRCVKNSQRITLPEGSDLENLHDNHVHGACRL